METNHLNKLEATILEMEALMDKFNSEMPEGHHGQVISKWECISKELDWPTSKRFAYCITVESNPNDTRTTY